MIDGNSSLEDVCFAVSDALRAHGMEAVLTGGSAAALYAPVAGDYVRQTATLTRGESTLRILTRTDCVRDRLAHFYHWNDYTALDAAVWVAAASPDEIDMALLLEWTRRERREFSAKLGEFTARLRDTVA